MKAYTDIEQSKKLAEFLPLESAYMYFEPSAGFCTEPSEVKVGDIKYAHPRSIPCWSLAALLDVLPLVETHKQTDGHKTYYYVELYMRRMKKEIYLSTERHESLVDACYEMIIKLKNMNLL